MKILETIVIGAGQAGLAAAWYLKKNQVNYLSKRPLNPTFSNSLIPR